MPRMQYMTNKNDQIKKGKLKVNNRLKRKK